jgi:chondroitin AC lyase
MCCACFFVLMATASPTADAQDVDTLRQRILAVSGKSNPQSVAASARKSVASLQEDGSWPDIDYADTSRSRWATAAHMYRLREMATAFHAEGSPLRGDAELKDSILRALDFWFEKDLRNPNWWWNEIGSQLTLGPSLLMLSDTLTPAQKDKGVALLKRSKWERWTGQNLVWGATIQVMRGCLEESPEVIRQAYDRLYEEILVVAPGREGIQVDFSFHQHGSQLYSGGYGRGFAEDNARFIHYARGTQFEAPEHVMDVMTGYLLDGQQWMVRGRTFDYSGVGREITRPGHYAGSIAHAAVLLAELPLKRQAEMAALATRMKSKDHQPPLVGNRHFWRSDYMAHHRAGYAASVRMTSARNRRSKICNSEGLFSHHLSDGVTYIYRTGDEYRDIFPVWDWERVPGITCLRNGDWEGKGSVSANGETSFVGGVSDGMNGLAAMDFKRGTLSARKAWFYFDDVFVCLGSGITCTAAGPVITSINQCHLKGDVLVSGQDGSLQQGDHVLDDVTWVLHDSVGYAFPEGQSLHIGNQAQTGKWSNIGTCSDAEVSLDVFSLWIEHGQSPDGASYAYVVYPDTNRSAIEEASSKNPVEIIANTPLLQAVHDAEDGVLQVAFHEPGTVTASTGRTIKADQPCLVLVREEGDAVHVAVSNPENAPLIVNVSINQALSGENCTNVGEGRSTIRFDLPDGPMAGSSAVRTLRK